MGKRKYYIGSDRGTVYAFGDTEEDLQKEAAFQAKHVDNYTPITGLPYLFMPESSDEEKKQGLKANDLGLSDKKNLGLTNEEGEKVDENVKSVLVTDKQLQQTKVEGAVIFDSSEEELNPDGLKTDKDYDNIARAIGSIPKPLISPIFNDVADNITSWLLKKGDKFSAVQSEGEAKTEMEMYEYRNNPKFFSEEEIAENKKKGPPKEYKDSSKGVSNATQKKLDDKKRFLDNAKQMLQEDGANPDIKLDDPKVVELAKTMYGQEINSKKFEQNVIETFFDGDSPKDLDNWFFTKGEDQNKSKDDAILRLDQLNKQTLVSVKKREEALKNLESTKSLLDDLTNGEYTTQSELDIAKAEYTRLVSVQKTNVSNFKFATNDYKASLKNIPELKQYIGLLDKNYNFGTQLVVGGIASAADIGINTSKAIAMYMDMPANLAIDSKLTPEWLKAGLKVADASGYSLSNIPLLGGQTSLKDIGNIKAYEQMRAGLGATVAWEDMKSPSDWGEYLGNLTANQVPQFALMMVAPQIALPILSLSAAGGKFKSIQAEIDMGADYSVADMYLAATMTAGVEYASERVTMGILKQNVLTGIGAKEARLGAIKYLRNEFLSVNTLKQGVEEGLSEVYATFGENFADKFILGKKDVNLTDGVGEAFFSGAFLANTMFKAPAITTALTMPFYGDQQLQKKDGNDTRIKELSKALGDPKLSPEAKEVIQNEIDDLVVENSIINRDTHQSIKYMTSEQKTELLENYKQKYKLQIQQNKLENNKNSKTNQDALKIVKTKLRKINAASDVIIQPALDLHFEDIKQGVVKILDTSGKELSINEIQEVDNWDAINDKIKLENKSKPDNKKESEVSNDTPGYIMENSDGTKTIVLNKNAALASGQVNVAAHELLHGVLDLAFKNDPAAKAKFGKSLIPYLTKINLSNIENTDFARRLSKYLDMAESGEYTEELAYEEAITLLGDSLVSGELQYNPSLLEKIGSTLSNIAKSIPLVSKLVPTNFSGPKDVLDFVVNFNKSVSEGELNNEVQKILDRGAVAKAKETKEVKEARNRKSINRAEEKINNLVGPRSLKTGKYTWKSKAEFQRSSSFKDMYYEIVEGDVMKPLILKGVNIIDGKVQGQSVDFYINSVKDQIALLLNNFDPSINNSLSGYINSLLFKKKGTVLKALKKRNSREISRDRTRSDGSSILMDSVDDGKLQDELLDDQLNNDIELEGKDDLKEGLGLDNTLVDDILAATEQSYFDNLGNIGSVNFITKLSQSAIKILKGPVLQVMGKGDSYIKVNANGTLGNSFLKNNKKLLLNNLSIAQLVSLERLSENKIFALPIKKLKTQAEIDKAVNDGLIVVRNEKSSPMLYKKLVPTDAQLIEFFNPPSTNAETGKIDNTKGNRKLALRNAIITALTLNATPDVTRDLFDNSIKAPLSIITNRNPNKRFNIAAIPPQSFNELNAAFRQLSGDSKIKLTAGFDAFFDRLSQPNANTEIAWYNTYGNFLENINGNNTAIKFQLINGFKKLKEQFTGKSFDFSTGINEKVNLAEFLYQSTEGMSQSLQVEKMFGLKPRSIKWSGDDGATQITEATQAISQFIQKKKIENNWTDKQTIDYLVNELGNGFNAAAKVGNNNLKWQKNENGVFELVNNKKFIPGKGIKQIKERKDKNGNVVKDKKGNIILDISYTKTNRYGFFTSTHQMVDILFPKAFEDGIVYTKTTNQGTSLYYKGGKKVARDGGQNTKKEPYLTELKKQNGSLKTETLEKSNDYAIEQQNALLDFIDFLKDNKEVNESKIKELEIALKDPNLTKKEKELTKIKIKDLTKEMFSPESVAMLFVNFGAHTSSLLRKGAPVNYTAGFSFDGKPGDFRYEHNPPVKVMKTYAVQYYLGEITKTEFKDKLSKFSVGIIPIFMDNALDLMFKESIPTPGVGAGQFRRLYNNSTWGLFPFITTFYNPNNNYTPELIGEGAPQAFEIAQAKEKADKVIMKGRLSVASNPQPKDPNKPNRLNNEINKIIEQTKGIQESKRYSDIVAKRKGAGVRNFRLIAPGAQDFNGLMYDLYARGKLGEQQMKWVKDNIINPYQKGVANIDIYRQALKNDYSALLKKFPDVAKKLGKVVSGTEFTYDQAIRVSLWTRAGYEIPGISKRDAKKLNDAVNNDIQLKTFADAALLISKRNKWVQPAAHWDVESLISDLNSITEKVGRKEFIEEFIENVETIFSKENLNKMEVALGTNWREAMEDSLYRMINGTNRPSGTNKLTNQFNNWVNNSIGAIMFFNRKSALLQTISSVNFLNWSDNNPIKAAMAFANFPQYIKDFTFLWNSPKLKQRRSGLRKDVNEAELANAAKGAKNKPAVILSYLLKLGFTPTQLADSFAIASGGATFYRNRLNTYLKQGLTQAEAETKAFEDFSETSDQSQQSADPMLISQQQAGILGRLLLAFQNTPAQVTRLFNKSSRDFINNRGDQKTNISKMAYYGAVQGLIFATLQNALFATIPGFADDDDDPEVAKENKERMMDIKKERIVNSMVDTMLRGSGVYGAIAATLKNTIITYYREEGKDAFSRDHRNTLIEALNLSPPIGSKLRKMNNAIKTKEYNAAVMEEQGWDVTLKGRVNLSPNYQVVASLTEAITNLPLERALVEIESFNEMLDSRNSTFQRIALALGYRSWDVGAKNEERDLVKIESKETKKIQSKIKREEEKERKKIEKEKLKYKGKSEAQIKLIKRKEIIYDQNKPEQVKTLKGFGLSSAQIKALKYEKDRVNKIIELQNKRNGN